MTNKHADSFFLTARVSDYWPTYLLDPRAGHRSAPHPSLEQLDSFTDPARPAYPTGRQRGRKMVRHGSR